MLVWMDLEMTGLDATHDVIVEIATIVTDDELNIVAEGPDLVITDVSMPKMKGTDLLARIKKLTPKTPVVVITLATAPIKPLTGRGKSMAPSSLASSA